MFVVPCKFMVVKRNSTFKLAINNFEFCSIICLTNLKIFLMAKPLVVICSNIGPKSFAELCKGILIADNIKFL